MSIKAVSLFSGCGGLDLGFHKNGVEILAAIDNDPAAIACYNHNFKKGGIVLDVTSKEYEHFLNSIKKVDIVLGGFPCQGFSKSGPKRKEDPRNTLYLSMLKAVKQLTPSVFVAENVDGLAQNFRGEILDNIMNDFTALGYKVEYRIIDAADFGVAQHRRRIFFIGSKTNCPIIWPTPTNNAIIRNGEFKSAKLLKSSVSHSKRNVKAALTLKDAISKIPKTVSDNITLAVKDTDLKIIKRIKEGQKLCNVRFGPSSVYTWQIPEVFGEITDKEVTILETIARNRRKKTYGNIPNGNPLSLKDISRLSNLKILKRDIEELIVKDYIKEIEGKYDIKGAMFCSGLYKRPKWNEPSPTIITLFHSPRYLVHPSENRPLTIRECARLQSFPDTFKFLDSGISIIDAYRLIGNAVAPQVSSHIADAVLKIITHKKSHETTKTKQRPTSMA